MRRTLVFVPAFVAITFITAWATIINIPDDYPTIQAGINASMNGDTVLVHPGTYVENVVFNGHNIVLGSLFLTTGDASYISSTILDGNSSGAVITLTDGEDNSAKIIGFTITNGISVFGGGINAWFTSPTILHNTIRDNVGTWYGGAISLEQCTAIVQYNVMVNNQAEYGGGLRASYGNPLIGNNLIINNYAEEWGGGIYVNNNAPLIINNTFSGNEAAAMGGGLRTGNASPTVTNCIFYGNSAPNGPEISAWGNPVVSYSDILGGYAGEGNIDADPLFVGGDPFDYHLQASSPCIDAGDPASPLDPDGTIADMGAFYYFAGTTTYGLSIADTYGENGQPVDLPVMAYGLESQEIAGVELHIDYDEACLEYSDFSSDYLTDALVNVVDGEIHILWEDYLNPVMIPDSAAMLNLQFNVLGQLGDSCPIAWLENNELVDPLGEVVEGLTFVDGSVNVVEFHDINGNVVYYDLSTPVPDVTVELTGDYSASDITDEIGAYSFEDLFPGEFTICPSRSEDDAGVTVTDIVLIRRHIVSLELFDTPYKLIAADVNGSGSVSVADVIMMRRYLAELEELPGGNWTFIDSSFVITDENWPDAPRCIDVTLWDADLTDSSFVGIRMGDVDYSWTQGRLGIPPPLVTDTAVLDLMDCYGQPGETIQMSINVAGFTDIAGLEMHIEFPSEGMRFVGFGSDVMADPTTNGIDGEIHFVWDDIFNVVSLEDGEEVVSIAFEISEEAPDSMMVSFTAAYVVDKEGIDFIVDSRHGYILLHQTSNYGNDIVLPESYRLSQNYPNPFNARTVIEFDLPEQSHVTIEVYDLLGRRVEILVAQIKEAGYHQVAWNAADQPSGIYFYRIEADEFADTKKMLLLK